MTSRLVKIKEKYKDQFKATAEHTVSSSVIKYYTHDESRTRSNQISHNHSLARSSHNEHPREPRMAKSDSLEHQNSPSSQKSAIKVKNYALKEPSRVASSAASGMENMRLRNMDTRLVSSRLPYNAYQLKLKGCFNRRPQDFESILKLLKPPKSTYKRVLFPLESLDGGYSCRNFVERHTDGQLSKPEIDRFLCRFRGIDNFFKEKFLKEEKKMVKIFGLFLGFFLCGGVLGVIALAQLGWFGIALPIFLIVATSVVYLILKHFLAKKRAELVKRMKRAYGREIKHENRDLNGTHITWRMGEDGFWLVLELNFLDTEYSLSEASYNHCNLYEGNLEQDVSSVHLNPKNGQERPKQKKGDFLSNQRPRAIAESEVLAKRVFQSPQNTPIKSMGPKQMSSSKVPPLCLSDEKVEIKVEMPQEDLSSFDFMKVNSEFDGENFSAGIRGGGGLGFGRNKENQPVLAARDIEFDEEQQSRDVLHVHDYSYMIRPLAED